MRGAVAGLAAIATIVGAPGCKDRGPQRVAVGGQVTLDDRPLAQGTIAFIPNGAAKGPKAGGVISQGKFEIPAASGPLVGPLLVEIRSGDRGPVDPHQHASDPPAPSVELIPDCYNNKTTLTAEATTAGPNRFTFPLFTKPKPPR